MKNDKSSLAVRAVGNVLTRLGGKVAEDISKEFHDQRQSEAENLYNAFVEVINNRKPSIETVLYVTRRLEFSVMDRQVNKNLSPADDARLVAFKEA